MDILKAFSLLDTEYQINIQGTLEDPLFQANQIGKLLGIGSLSENLRDFDNEEKVMYLTHTPGGKQEMIFLTETGLYRVLGRSRKPIAHKFQKWMVSVLKEIRINGIYKLQQDKEIDKQLYQYKCELSTHKTLLKAYDKKNLVYICKLKEDEFNFTSNPSIRLDNNPESEVPKAITSNSDFAPYITTVGLYTSFGELVAIGKLGTPIKKRDNVDLNLIVRFDI
jgi:prophage antirepressor-like protein